MYISASPNPTLPALVIVACRLVVPFLGSWRWQATQASGQANNRRALRSSVRGACDDETAVGRNSLSIHRPRADAQIK